MHNLSNLWDVLIIFLVPFGAGIPGGILLAKSRGINWYTMMLVYLVSDIILAIAFEPILHLFVKLGKKVEFFARIGQLMKAMIQKTIKHYGESTGVFALVMIAFGVDPMTGRAVAVAAGHGFVIGWMIAIAGDMMYFTVLMVSTLWLHDFLGDGTWTMLIILALMFILPGLIRRLQKRINF